MEKVGPTQGPGPINPHKHTESGPTDWSSTLERMEPEMFANADLQPHTGAQAAHAESTLTENRATGPLAQGDVEGVDASTIMQSLDTSAKQLRQMRDVIRAALLSNSISATSAESLSSEIKGAMPAVVTNLDQLGTLEAKINEIKRQLLNSIETQGDQE